MCDLLINHEDGPLVWFGYCFTHHRIQKFAQT